MYVGIYLYAVPIRTCWSAESEEDLIELISLLRGLKLLLFFFPYYPTCWGKISVWNTDAVHTISEILFFSYPASLDVDVCFHFDSIPRLREEEELVVSAAAAGEFARLFNEALLGILSTSLSQSPTHTQPVEPSGPWPSQLWWTQTDSPGYSL